MPKCALLESESSTLMDDNDIQAYLWYDKNWKHDTFEHNHERSQLSFVSEGYQYFHIDQKIYLVPQNHAIWIPSKVSHRISSEADQVYLIVLLFRMHPDKKFYEKVQVFPVPTVLREMLFYASRWNKLLVASDQQQSFLNAILANLSDFCQENKLLEIPVPTDERLLPICGYINTNYALDKRIDDYAEIGNMSTRNLQRIFKRETGLTIQKYIQLIRILKSVELIATKKYRLTEIAYKVGYKSLSAFSSSYRTIMKSDSVPR